MDDERRGEFYCKGFFDPAPQPRPQPLTPGPGWERSRDLSWPDEALAAAYRRSQGAFFRAGAEGFSLAYPLDCRAPFPLPELFCFARAECLGGRGWWVFSFDSRSLPCFSGA